MTSDPIRLPKDKAARDALAKFAGLTDEERAAIDQWCADEEAKRRGGVTTTNEAEGGRDF